MQIRYLDVAETLFVNLPYVPVAAIAAVNCAHFVVKLATIFGEGDKIARAALCFSISNNTECYNGGSDGGQSQNCFHGQLPILKLQDRNAVLLAGFDHGL